MSHPSLPSLTVSALLVPLPFSSWIVRHSDIELAAQPTWMDNATSDHRPYLSAPTNDAIEPAAFPGDADDSTVEEFSFRSAWEMTRSLESLPPAWRSTYRRWNNKLSTEHRLSMSAGGAHRYAQHEPVVIHTPPAPPPPAVIELGMSSSRRSDMRARLYRRLGVVRCARTRRLARDPDSAWTTIAGLDRRIAWAHT